MLACFQTRPKSYSNRGFFFQLVNSFLSPFLLSFLLLTLRVSVNLFEKYEKVLL